MNSPEVREMQRKNMALTQNFAIYQQLFQTFLMMNFKKKMDINPSLTKENFEGMLKQKELEEQSHDKFPNALQNMMNFINTNFKEKS